LSWEAGQSKLSRTLVWTVEGDGEDGSHLGLFMFCGKKLASCLTLTLATAYRPERGRF
jgi:hypothetical protein